MKKYDELLVALYRLNKTERLRWRSHRFDSVAGCFWFREFETEEEFVTKGLPYFFQMIICPISDIEIIVRESQLVDYSISLDTRTITLKLQENEDAATISISY